jgi:hypothetical protein
MLTFELIILCKHPKVKQNNNLGGIMAELVRVLVVCSKKTSLNLGGNRFFKFDI